MRIRRCLLCSIAAVAVLIACCGGTRATNVGVSRNEQAVVLKSMGALQRALNSDSCDDILKLTVAPLREGKYSPRNWPEQCRALTGIAGTWQSFDTKLWYKPGRTLVVIAGKGTFSKSGCAFEVTWDLSPLISPSPSIVTFAFKFGERMFLLAPKEHPPDPLIRDSTDHRDWS
jgi:hypothetical protein